jgi:Flp pilus assembly protein TadD
MIAAQPRLAGTAIALAGRVNRVFGNFGTARRILEEGQRACPDDPAPLAELGELLFYHASPGEAAPVLMELGRRQPENASTQHNLGTVLSWLGRYDEATEAFNVEGKQRHTASVLQDEPAEL